MVFLIFKNLAGGMFPMVLSRGGPIGSVWRSWGGWKRGGLTHVVMPRGAVPSRSLLSTLNWLLDK